MSTKNNLVVVSDMHIGCRRGLCPPDGVELDDGGRYHPDKLQKKIWSMWENFWKVFVPTVTQGDEYDLLINGDVVDGAHHNGTTQISQNPEDQRRMALKIIDWIDGTAEKLGDLYWTRGTEAHVGQSSHLEETLARECGALPDEEGKYARYELWYRMKGGGLIQAMHHVGTTSSMAYEATALGKEMAEMNAECARWGLEVPDVIVRSHRHRHIEVRLPAKNTTQIAVVTPCWQAKTPFVWKIAGARISVPQFGGIVIRRAMHDGQPGDLYTRAAVWTPARSKPVE